MKRQARLFLSLMAAPALALVLGTGCMTTSPRDNVVYVSTAPPMAIAEVHGMSPGAEFVWIGGFHRWDGTRHTWNGGRWEKRPNATSTWEAGTWRHHRNGWYWTEGRWR